MTASTSAQTLRVFFCGDSKTTYQQELECSSLVSKSFGNTSVFLNSPSPFLSSEDERIAQATTLLARDILELHDLSKRKGAKGDPQRFLVFTYGEGIKVAELTLKKLFQHNIDIHVYSFGGTTTLIPKNLACTVHHYVFQTHLNPQYSILARMHSILLKMDSQKLSYEVAVIQEASEKELENALNRNGEDFFNPELMSRMKKYEGYFKSYWVTFLDESPSESPYGKESCEFFAYARIFQEIVQSEYNPQC